MPIPGHSSNYMPFAERIRRSMLPGHSIAYSLVHSAAYHALMAEYRRKRRDAIRCGRARRNRLEARRRAALEKYTHD
jgi:hypothetical protein